MNKSVLFALFLSLATAACTGEVVVVPEHAPADDAGETADAAPCKPDAPPAVDAGRDVAPTTDAAPDAGSDGPTYRGCDPSSCATGVNCCDAAADDGGTPEAAPACTSCCRVPVGMTTCPADWGCGACCDTLDDGGANPLCPQ